MMRMLPSLLILAATFSATSGAAFAADVPRNEQRERHQEREQVVSGVRPFGRASTGEGRRAARQMLELLGAKGLAGGSPREIEGYNRVFQRLDSNGDGKLTKQEYIEDGRYGTKEMRTGIFGASDRDADGIVTEEEYVQNRIITDEAKQIFQKMDENDNRNVTEEELIENSIVQGRKTAKELFRKLDTDSNGEVGMIEFLRSWGDLARKGASRVIAERQKELGDTRIAQQAGPPMRGPGFPVEGGPGMRGAGSGFRPPEIPLMLALDADENGEISAAEIENAVAALKKLDKNNDGKLSRDELRPQFGFPGGGRMGADAPPDFGPPGGADMRGPGRGFRFPALPLMTALDADEDEEISAAEMKNAAAALKKLDKNNDGKLSRDELRPELGGPGGFGPPGGPGSRRRELVPKFDKDGDGKLNDEERAAARTAAREQRRGGFGPFGGQAPAPEPDTQPSAERVTPPTTGVIPPNTDLYDDNTLRTLYLQFANPDWYAELGDFYRTDVEVPADLIVDGMTYPGVGVRFRGNSSYFGIGQSKKKPFNISIEYTDEEQRLYGYKTLNLHNCHSDPTFLREVLYSRICREYEPALKANLVNLVVNGENWGVYANVQQFNKDFLQDWCGSKQGIRWKVGTFGRGGALNWLGPDPNPYQSSYELKTKDAPDAWQALIQLCETLNTTPDDQLEAALNAIFDVDQALWLIALENIFIDEGYVTRGADYAVYTDGRYGRFHMLSLDNNETLTYGGGPFFGLRISGAELDPLALADDDSRPVIHRLLSIPHLRARYLAHVRTIVNDWLDWDVLAPIVERYQNLIASGVKADTKKFFSYEEFIHGHVQDYIREGPPGGGPFGGGLPRGGPPGGWLPGAGPPQEGAPGQGPPGGAPSEGERPFGGERMLRRFNTNSDGMISKDEGSGRAQRFIQDFDRNGDGVVTREELSQSDRGVPGGRRRAGGRPGQGPGGFGGGPGGGVTPSLKRFVEERREFLLNHPAMSKPAPVIQDVSHHVTASGSGDSVDPLPTEPVHVQARITGEVAADSVILYYAEARWAPFDQVLMFDDGKDNDGKAGDGLYGGDVLPFPAGTEVHYYVEARAPASVGTTTFFPVKAEFGALTYKVATPIASTSPIVINELMAANDTAIRDPQGEYDDWIELLNVSDQEVDLSGMYLSDRKDNPRKWAFPNGTMLAPGAYLMVWADEDVEAEAGLHANFKLSKSGEVVMLIDADERGNALLDSVTFSKQRDDVALARMPNGKGAFRALQATPGGTNKNQ